MGKRYGSRDGRGGAVARTPLMNGELARRHSECVLIGADGENRGTVGIMEALDAAGEAECDLVMVGTSGDGVPICRMMDWSKERYRRQKRERANRRNAQKDVKQMKFRTKIGDGDLEHKMRLVNGFLDDGHKCVLTVMFRGREASHPELGEQILMRAVDIAEGHGVMTSAPKLAGRDMSITLSPTRGTRGDVDAL